MKILTSIITTIGLLVTLAFTVVPIGYLIIFPALITIICAVILGKILKKDGSHSKLPKLIIIVTSICLAFSVGRELVTEDHIEIDSNFEQREENSKNDAIKDLEDL